MWLIVRCWVQYQIIRQNLEVLQIMKNIAEVWIWYKSYIVFNAIWWVSRKRKVWVLIDQYLRRINSTRNHFSPLLSLSINPFFISSKTTIIIQLIVELPGRGVIGDKRKVCCLVQQLHEVCIFSAANVHMQGRRGSMTKISFATSKS